MRSLRSQRSLKTLPDKECGWSWLGLNTIVAFLVENVLAMRSNFNCAKASLQKAQIYF